MRSLPAVAFAALALPAALAQSPGCATPESRQMDFWLGEWDASWVMNGKPGKGRNRISKVLGGCVVLEEFSAPDMPLEGRSWSMWDAASGRWKQTWVDDSGGYLDFVGAVVDGNRVFARDAERNGKAFKQRMVFTDVKPDAFRWLWQRSDDAGATWKTAWEIDYRRVK